MPDETSPTEAFLSNIDSSHIEPEPVDLHTLELSLIELIQPDLGSPKVTALNHGDAHTKRVSSTLDIGNDKTKSATATTPEMQSLGRGSRRTMSDSIQSKPKPDMTAHREKPTASRFRRIRRFLWWWEVLATLIGVISTVLIVVILSSMNGKPLSKWKTSVIQPNSLVAIFSTIAKSSLLVPLAECLGQLKWAFFERKRRLDHFQSFDSASRGPWGAFRFLWMTRCRAILGTVGAIATIFMLAFEPFAQQVTQYQTRHSEVRISNGSVGVAYAWSDLRTQNASGESWASAGEKCEYPCRLR